MVDPRDSVAVAHKKRYAQLLPARHLRAFVKTAGIYERDPIGVILEGANHLDAITTLEVELVVRRDVEGTSVFAETD